MADFDIGATKRTDVAGRQSSFEVGRQQLDTPQDVAETFYDYPDADINLGYYKNIPELKKAIDKLATWVTGKGVEADVRTVSLIENWTGNGKDTGLSILWNLQVMKKVTGDAFAEIIRNDKGDTINLKPLYAGDMRIIFSKEGIIEKYQQIDRKSKNALKSIQPQDILHISNDRVGNEVHGTPVPEVTKWVIDARNEAMRDYRKVLHRNVVPVRILEIETDNAEKRDALIKEYEQMIKDAEVLVIPKGTVSFNDTQIQVQDPLPWVEYLENFFYQAVGIPRVIASSKEFSEAASKVSYLTFEPIYSAEQVQLEQALKQQLGLEVKFERPPSLTGVVEETQQDELKNTSQTGIQKNETQISATRTE